MTNHLVQWQHIKLTNRGPQIYVEQTFLLLCPLTDLVSQMWLVGASGKAHIVLQKSAAQSWVAPLHELDVRLIAGVAPEVWLPLQR